jgi:RNA polymerase sigma-70 factor (ECF subfamily)
MALDRGAAAVPAAETREVPAFDALYAEYFRSIWRTLRRLGVASAQLDDAAQEVFIIVHRRLPEFDGRSVRGWLYAITVRVASEHRRAAAHRRTAPLDEDVLDPAPDPAARREFEESLQLLHLLLAALDEKKRAVFVLGELEELSAPEIAEALALNLNTVYSRLRSARLEFDAALRRQREREARRSR